MNTVVTAHTLISSLKSLQYSKKRPRQRELSIEDQLRRLHIVIMIINLYIPIEIINFLNASLIYLIMGFWGFGVLGFWGFGVLGFWGSGVLGFWGFGVLVSYSEAPEPQSPRAPEPQSPRAPRPQSPSPPGNLPDWRRVLLLTI